MTFVEPNIAYFNYREYKPMLYRKHRGCQACRNDNYAELVLHHVTYERYGQEVINDLRLLCFRCHNELHKKIKGSDPDLRHWTNLFIKCGGIWVVL